MATIRLVPSAYTRSSTSRVTVTDPENAYDNTSDTSDYASFRGRNNSSNTYYAFLHGFNFDDVPSNATVTGFRVLIRCYRNSYQQTGSTYRLRLASQASNSYVISGTTTSTDIDTSASVIEIPTGDLTWEQLANYGSGLSIEMVLRPSSNQYPYIYVYGAEIEVEYSVGTPVTITTTLTGSGTIDPAGTTSTYSGTPFTLTISPTNSTDAITVTNNGVDVSNQLVQQAASGTISAIAESYTVTVTQGSLTNSSYLGDPIGYSAESPHSTRSDAVYTSTRGYVAYAEYSFDFSDIPSNATITAVEVKCYGLTETTDTYTYSMARVQLYSGSSTKGASQDFTSTSAQTITLNNPGTWTRSELQNAKLRFSVGRYGGWLGGITWKITYSLNGVIYTYTFTPTGNALIEVTIGDTGPFIPPEEDPNETYWPITISSINADTDPPNGTVRVVEGTNQTISITPSDPQLTLALDNGVDITSQLQGGAPNNSYTVTTQQTGASYGFPLNSSTGYYTSNNDGVSNSAAVSRINFNLETAVVVTIQYINYAEATYDYGIFGQIDTALGTTYSADSNPYLSCATNAYNQSSPQTITYNISAGSHFIDIKYRKDSGVDSYNDTLQWKIISIEATGTSGSYTYTLTNVNQKHSLIFIFGNVNFYWITSSATSGAKLFPDGQMVKLQGDSYKLVIIPDNVNSSIVIKDNGVTVTSQLERTDGYDTNNNPIVNYVYTLTNIAADHGIVIQIGGQVIQLYAKINGTWTPFSKVYRKINGSWVEQTDLSGVFNTNVNYVKSN